MKKLILSAAVALTMSFNAFATSDEPVVSAEAQHTLEECFQDADAIIWSDAGNNYEAYFTVNGVKTRALIDSKGKLKQTISYYGAAELPAVVLAEVKSDYKAYEIFGVTEVSNKNGLHYEITLKDDLHYKLIRANSAGESNLVKTYKRGDR